MVERVVSKPAAAKRAGELTAEEDAPEKAADEPCGRGRDGSRAGRAMKVKTSSSASGGSPSTPERVLAVAALGAHAGAAVWAWWKRGIASAGERAAASALMGAPGARGCAPRHRTWSTLRRRIGARGL